MGILRWWKRRWNGSLRDRFSNDDGSLRDELIAGARRVRVRAVLEPTVYYEASSRDDLASLARALQTDPADGGCCLCRGTLVFEVESATGSAAISFHHGETLRWAGARGNVALRSPYAIMDWLSARGLTFVREAYDATRTRGEKLAAQRRRWRSLLPASLAPFFHEMRRSGGGEQPEWTAAIERELPELPRRAAVLLALFGSGVGPWTNYPSYESVPEHLLWRLPLDVILAAIGDAADERIREGAARLFSSHLPSKLRRKYRARVPVTLKATLLAHVEATGDDDKRARARRALAP